MAREFLPRDFFDLPASDDDEAIVGRGPNILLRDRARLLARRRLSQPVGRAQPNQPEDVVQVETLLRATGNLDSSRDHEPIGYFSGYLDNAIHRFQGRNGLAVDGIVNPDGETMRALADEQETARQAECQAVSIRIENLRLARDDLVRKLDELSRQNDALDAEIEALEAERSVFLEALRAAGVSVAEDILRGRLDPRTILRDAILAGVQAGAQEFIRVQTQINERLKKIEDNVREMNPPRETLKSHNAEIAALLDQRRRLGCRGGTPLLR